MVRPILLTLSLEMLCFVCFGKTLPRRFTNKRLLASIQAHYIYAVYGDIWWEIVFYYPWRRHHWKFGLQVYRNGTFSLEMWWFVCCGKTPPRRFTNKRLFASTPTHTLRRVWCHLIRNCPPNILDVDTKANLDSRSTEMALCYLKCDVVSILVKRHHVASLKKDFSFLYKLITLQRVWWHLMRNRVPPIILDVDRKSNSRAPGGGGGKFLHQVYINGTVTLIAMFRLFW